MRNLLTWTTMRWGTQEWRRGSCDLCVMQCYRIFIFEIWENLGKVRRRVRLVMRNGDAGCLKMWKGTICNPWANAWRRRSERMKNSAAFIHRKLESQSQGVNEFRFPNVLPQSKNFRKDDNNESLQVRFEWPKKKHWILFQFQTSSNY